MTTASMAHNEVCHVHRTILKEKETLSPLPLLNSLVEKQEFTTLSSHILETAL